MITTHAYLIAVVLAGVVSFGMTQRAIDFRQIAKPRIANDPTCTAPGLMCLNCENVQSCINIGNSNPPQFTSTVLQKCNDSSWCLNGVCTPKTTLNPICEQDYLDAFVCPEYHGVFPDPADCKKFHMCVPKAGETAGSDPTTYTNNDWNCEPGYGYNARTKVCDKKLVNNQCPGFPVPICKVLGQQAALLENPSIFYMCIYRKTGSTVLYPNLYTCTNGMVYNNKYGCQ